MKYRQILMPVLGIAAIAAAAGSAAAQQGPGPGQGMRGPGQGPMMQGRGAEAGESRHEHRMQRWVERRLALLDTDGDGKVSQAEIDAEQKRLFTAADVNGDGKLSADEFERRGRWFFQLRTLTFFDLLDANGDGVITVEEINNPSQRWFKRKDADKSGTLEAEEMAPSGHGRFGRH